MTKGEKLRELRTRAGLSIRAASEAVGMKTPSNWQHYENDAYQGDEFPADLTIRLANALTGKGDPPITLEEVVDFSPTLRGFIARRGAKFRASVSEETSEIKLSLDVEVHRMEQLSDIVSAFHEAFSKISSKE